MCGIAGVIADARVENPSGALRRMTDAIHHRGPDDEGFFETRLETGKFVGLGHRRLAIIDLSTGHQPIGNEDNSVNIVFNGEIYNFRELRDELKSCGHTFSTNSDTEVIVHAYEEYGEDCVHHLRGMFAFAIWDDNRQQLFIARDRFGKKPLFMTERDGLFLFASEIKALRCWPDIEFPMNTQVVADYLTYRYVPGPNTLASGVRKLQPGTHATWRDGQLTERRYYSPPDKKAFRTSGSVDTSAETFLGHLDEAVRIRMVSDVPFGAFLSGGIDSSAIVALMARHSSLPVKTFSVGFAEGQYSELEYARAIADQFKTEHYELKLSADDLITELPALIAARDAPVSEPSDIPIYLLSKEARRTVKMVLTGEGSDEFLGGYRKHIYERYAPAYQRIPRAIRRKVIDPLVHSLPYQFRSIKTGITNLGIEDWTERMPRWFGAMSFSEGRDLLIARHNRNTEHEFQFDVEPENSSLRKILFFDQASWLPDNLLERGDRMTMAASIEARMPFMDHQLVAYISSLPDRCRVRGRTTKWILRESLKLLLPAKIINRPKIGFRVPVNEWFRGPMREYLHEHICGPDSVIRQYMHPQYLDRLFHEHAGGHQNHEKLLWALLNLELWHRINDAEYV